MGTYAEDPNRFDSTQNIWGVKITTAATPVLPTGGFAFNPVTGKLIFNTSTNSATPVFRTIANT